MDVLAVFFIDTLTQLIDINQLCKDWRFIELLTGFITFLCQDTLEKGYLLWA